LVTELGEKPMPEIEPAEPPPGGVDAVEEELYAVEPVVPDLASALNPHVSVPEPVTEGEDTGTEGTTDGASEPEKESPT
jgi:hypothetical protein